MKLRPYIVVYDLTIPTAQFGTFFAVLGQFKNAQRFTHSAWLIRSELGADAIANHLRGFMQPGDKITVIEMAARWQAQTERDDSLVGWLWNFVTS